MEYLMENAYTILLFVIFAIFLVSAYFFAFSESATIAAQRVILEHIGSEGDPRAAIIQKLRDDPRLFFGTTLIGTNMCIVTMSGVGAHALLHEQLGMNITIATIIVDVLVLVAAEITPKTVSLSNATLNSLKIARMLDFAAKILFPITWLITYLPSKALNIENAFKAEVDEITADQIKHMINIGAVEGCIDTCEGERAVNVFKFKDTTIDQIMTPTADMATLTNRDTVHQALQLINRTGFSRIPVLSKDGGDCLGYLSAKDILAFHKEGKFKQLDNNHLRPIIIIPETKKALSLMSYFRSSGEQIVIVVNEFGTITGLVTLEDLLEEFLGEIFDEYDPDAPSVQWIDGKLIMPGSFPVEKLAEQLKIELPEGDFDTVAGLFLDALGHLPKAGEKVDLNGWELIATHVVRNRITHICVTQKKGSSPQGREAQS